MPISLPVETSKAWNSYNSGSRYDWSYGNGASMASQVYRWVVDGFLGMRIRMVLVGINWRYIPRRYQISLIIYCLLGGCYWNLRAFSRLRQFFQQICAKLWVPGSFRQHLWTLCGIQGEWNRWCVHVTWVSHEVRDKTSWRHLGKVLRLGELIHFQAKSIPF